jgi:lipopolysaccharide transport system ATP-binding protein
MQKWVFYVSKKSDRFYNTDMSDTIIRVENLSKKYIIGHQSEGRSQYVALRDVIANGAKSLVQRIQNPKSKIQNQYEEFWALKDVSFEVKQGEAIGIIGRNGAGKSTLLKILSRITEPTTGRVAIKGRVASLLEVGTGFHPELTGRENIYLNGAILGMSKAEIKRKFDEIVAFAEVEKFLDTPVKRYSSGMYVRLAFAVAAHLEPEILVVDEVLAVGDVAFQKKCLGKMGDVATKEGRTVFFVSHNMVALESLCKSALWLDRGKLIDIGETNTVVPKYLQQGISSNFLERVWDNPETAPGNEKVRIHHVSITPLDQDKYEPITVKTPLQFKFQFWNYLDNTVLNLSPHIYNLEGICIFNTFNKPQLLSQGLVEGSFIVPGNFFNDGIYKIRLMIVQDSSVSILNIDDILTFEIQDISRKVNWFGKWMGSVRPQFDWEIKLYDDQAKTTKALEIYKKNH